MNKLEMGIVFVNNGAVVKKFTNLERTIWIVRRNGFLLKDLFFTTFKNNIVCY